MASVRFENISISYGNVPIVSNLDLEVKDGEIMGIIGPSGCGKTTLIRALGGFIKPQTGNIYMGDKLVYSAEKRINIPPEQRGIGIVFQDYAVWPHKTVWENICYPMKKRKVAKEKIIERANYALDQVRMKGYEKHMPSQLSGGQQQRVAIARALVSSGELIILDEPITNLDAKLREEMIVEIQMIQKRIGTTIIYITHDQEAALQLCDRIAIMRPSGAIAQIGTDTQIIKQPSDRYVYQFIGVSNFVPLKRHSGLLVTESEPSVKVLDGIPEEIGSAAAIDMGVRPMNIVFDDASPIRGTITHSVFLGSEYDYFVTLGGESLRVERNALDVLEDTREYHEGDEVGLKFINPVFYAKEVS